MRLQPRPPAAQASPAPSIHRANASYDRLDGGGGASTTGLGLQAASNVMFFFSPLLCFSAGSGFPDSGPSGKENGGLAPGAARTQ